MKSRAFVCSVIFFIGSPAFSAQEVKTLRLPAEGLAELEIDCGAGFLKVQGIEGLDAIEVKAEISAKRVDEGGMKGFIQDNVTLTLEKKGARAVLVSEIESHSLFSSHNAQIDLTVSVPEKMGLSVDDGSGSIEIENIIGNVHIEDGSGSMRVENVKGNLEIDDGSGELEVRRVTGDLVIDDGSGSISVADIGGSVTLDDGSGSIDIDGVEKDLTLKETGSGGLHFRNVKGNVVK